MMATARRPDRGIHGVLRSPGKPLDAPARARFESRFQHDFSRVRVHDDAPAARSASDLGARAWTFGNDIAFGRGMYAPSTPFGDALLGHELRHVVQQQGLPAPSTPEVAADDTAPPRTQQVQRSALSTFLDVVLFVPRLFGLEVFPAEELKQYLEQLKRGPRKSLFSDNMARACVSRENELGPYSTDQKVGLVQDMLHGRASFLDEGSIIALLRRSKDRAEIVSRIGKTTLLSSFSGRNWRIVDAVMLTAADAGEPLVTRLRNLDPDQVQDYVANATDPAVAESAKRALALSRITAPVKWDVTLTQSGKGLIRSNGFTIYVLPDVIKPENGKLVLTNAEFQFSAPQEIAITPANANTPVGEAVIPNPFPRMTLWTEYSSEEQKKHRPGFGVGTRPTDKQTIREHESAHGQAWLDFVRDHPAPQFSGNATMLPAAFNAAVRQFKADIQKYSKDAREYSYKMADCVAGGQMPTDAMLAGTGFTAAICKENP